MPGHLQLLDRLVSMLRSGGWLAFQVPGNFGEPSHTELAAVCAAPRWRQRLGDAPIATGTVHQPATYLARLAGLGLTVDAWETTYLHVLPGRDAVLEWMRGTALRRVLSRLSGQDAAQLEAEYSERLRRA